MVLGSKSPRRKDLLSQLGLNVRVEPLKVKETYPEHLSPEEIVSFLAAKKNDAYKSFGLNEVLITSDTLVYINKEILGKPKDREEARDMLEKLSGTKHSVLTGVCINGMGIYKKSFLARTEVSFKRLSAPEINYYLDNFNPYDKAGAYGIQEWIGMVAVKRIEGSYYNVVGLPVNKVVKELIAIHDTIT